MVLLGGDSSRCGAVRRANKETQKNGKKRTEAEKSKGSSLFVPLSLPVYGAEMTHSEGRVCWKREREGNVLWGAPPIECTTSRSFFRGFSSFCECFYEERGEGG